MHLSRLKVDHAWGCTPYPVFSAWSLKVLQPHRLGHGPAVLSWVEVRKKPHLYPVQRLQLCRKSTLTAFTYVMVKVLQRRGQGSFCLDTLSCQSFTCPKCSEPRVKDSCVDWERLRSVCNYSVPVERTEPHTYSNSWLWECWEALPASCWASGSYCRSSRCVSVRLVELMLHIRDGVGTSW